MATRQYIGARYVPKFYENPDTLDATWKSGVVYEPLTMVTYNNATYTSKKEVPQTVSDPAANPSYWVATGNYNGQIAYLQQQIGTLTNLETFDKSNLVAAINEVNSKIVTPEMYGAEGDGVTDDTLAIQAAVDSGCKIVLFSPKTYLVSHIKITNKSHLHLMGMGCTIEGDGTENFIIEFTGNINSVLIEDFTITCDSTTASTFICAIGCDSGNSLDDVIVRRCHIYNVNVGVSFNADLSGHLSNCKAEDNIISDILGTSVGQGYGIHFADGVDEPANCYARNNFIDNCSRHSIYLARGRNYEILNNIILNHRKDVYDTSNRSAIEISRSSNVLVDGNIVDTFADGALSITGEAVATGYPLSSYPANNITIVNNKFLNQVNLTALWVGYLYQGTTGISENVIIANNIFENTAVKNSIDVHYAKDLMISGNSVKNGYFQIGSYNMGASDKISFTDNQFDNASGESFEILSNWATANIETLFAFNTKTGAGSMFDTHTIITNTEVSFVGVDKSGYSASSSFKQVYVNSIAM